MTGFWGKIEAAGAEAILLAEGVRRALVHIVASRSSSQFQHNALLRATCMSVASVVITGVVSVLKILFFKGPAGVTPATQAFGANAAFAVTIAKHVVCFAARFRVDVKNTDAETELQRLKVGWRTLKPVLKAPGVCNKRLKLKSV